MAAISGVKDSDGAIVERFWIPACISKDIKRPKQFSLTESGFKVETFVNGGEERWDSFLQVSIFPKLVSEILVKIYELETYFGNYKLI